MLGLGFSFICFDNEARAAAQGAGVLAADVNTVAQALLKEGKAALRKGKYEQAIKSFKNAMSESDRESAEYRTALEFLGVTFERSGRVDRAESTFERYLKLFPTGEDANRVRQRLTSIQTARSAGRKKLKFARRKREKVEFFGSFSQFSIRDVTRQSNGDYTSEASLLSDFDLSGRYRSERLDVKTQLATNHRHDFKKNSTTPNDDLRLSTMYIGIRDRKLGLYGSFGRQTGSSGGVLGRYDGAWLSYDFKPQWTVNMVAGVPVELSGSSDTNRFFYGLSIDAGTFQEHWDFNGFLINQLADDLTDRRAIGGEVRYNDLESSYLGLLDYDVVFSRLNSALVIANWFFPASTTINIVADYRTSPLLTVENALIGQLDPSVGALLTRFSEAQVRSLALDRTSEVSSLTLSATKPINSQFQASADMTISRQSGNPASGGQPAIESAGYQYLYSIQVIGSELFKPNDVTTASLRHSDSANEDISTLDINMRYPLTQAWQADPRIGVDYRQDNVAGNETLTVRPSFRLDYAWKRNVTYDIELGMVWANDLGSGAGDDLDFNFELGYRVDF